MESLNLDKIKIPLVIIITMLYVVFFVKINATETNSDARFTDHNNISNWASSSVEELYDLGAITGDEDAKFNPQLKLTRAEFAKMLALTFEVFFEEETEATYLDVSEENWFYEYVVNVSCVMNGDGNSFRPNDNITREEIAVIINRVLELEDGLIFDIEDSNEVSTWANRSIQNITTYKLMTVDEANSFYPKEVCTREMTAVILSRSLAFYSDATKTNIDYKTKYSLEKAEEYMLKTINTPEIGSIGGEWAVIGFAINNAKVKEEFFSDYWSKASLYVENQDQLTERKFSNKITDVQRIAIAMKASGYDPKGVSDKINLIDYTWNKAENMSDLSEDQQKLGERQGLNELIYGLINIDLYPEYTYNNANITREEIIDLILEYQADDGGFSAVKNAEKTDVDYTSMVIYALSNYDLTQVDDAIEALVKMQLESGGFGGNYESNGDIIENSESLSQVIMAFSSLNIDIHNYFTENGKPSPIEALFKYQNTDGSFSHIMNGGVDQMATEQAYIALGVYSKIN